MSPNLRIARNDKTQMPDERLVEPLIPGQLGRDAVESIRRIHVAFLKSVETGLSELLQTPVTASFTEVSQRPFSGALNANGSKEHAVALDLAPVRGYGFLTFPSQLLFRVLDILLATPENTSPDFAFEDSQRSVTAIELHILGEFFTVFARTLRETWAPYYPVAFKQIVTEEGPAVLAAAYGDDMALILRASIDLAGETWEVNLVLPAFLARFVQLKSKAPADALSGIEPSRRNILDSLSKANLRMDAVLEGASIRIRSLLELTPGHILVFGSSESAPVDCLVNGRRQFTGELIAAQGRRAIQIERLSGAAENQFTRDSVKDK